MVLKQRTILQIRTKDYTCYIVSTRQSSYNTNNYRHVRTSELISSAAINSLSTPRITKQRAYFLLMVVIMLNLELVTKKMIQYIKSLSLNHIWSHFEGVGTCKMWHIRSSVRQRNAKQNMFSGWCWHRVFGWSLQLVPLYLVSHRLCATPKALVYLYSPNIAFANGGNNARLRGEIQTRQIKIVSLWDFGIISENELVI